MTNALAIRTPTQLAVRSKIDGLHFTMKEEIEAGRMEQTIVNCKKDADQADHYFGEGVYARALLIPAGTCVISHIHKQDRVCMIMSGECTFVDEWQKETVKAPYIGEFKAGSKTAVYAHTDTLWVACLGTHLKDAATAIDELVETTHEEYQLYLEHIQEK